MTPFWTCAVTNAAAKTNTKEILTGSRIFPPTPARYNNSTGDFREAILLPIQRRIAGYNAKTRAIVGNNRNQAARHCAYGQVALDGEKGQQQKNQLLVTGRTMLM